MIANAGQRERNLRVGFPALEFFAGSGLAAEALKPYFRTVWANDICPKKAATYRANHPPEALHLASIADVHGGDLPRAFLAWASFPCQDLSLAGNLGGIDSPRSGLVWQWLRVLDEMRERPRVVVAENVLGLISASGGAHYRTVHAALAERGYRVGAVLLDAIRWLPQSRPRVFIVGVDARVNTADLQCMFPLWCHPKAIQRVAGLVQDFAWWRLPEPTRQRGTLTDLIDFDAPTDDPQKVRRTMDLIGPAHRSRMHESVNGKAAAFPGYKRTRYGRQVLELRFDDVAGCLRTPRGGSSRQVVVVYRGGKFSTRLLTVKEAARLMGVRKSYRIEGAYNDGYKAMGDAVAVPVVRHLARHLLAPLAMRASRLRG
jgi:DNA (cytosine-5)-methyltransferase 1